MSDFALAVIVSVGDLIACGIGKAIGRTLHVDAQKSQRMGRIVFAVIIVGVGVGITIIYS